nr:MAG TPA_asm: hypothetical protein [Caudoviricetes sp.]
MIVWSESQRKWGPRGPIHSPRNLQQPLFR